MDLKIREYGKFEGSDGQTYEVGDFKIYNANLSISNNIMYISEKI